MELPTSSTAETERRVAQSPSKAVDYRNFTYVESLSRVEELLKDQQTAKVIADVGRR